MARIFLVEDHDKTRELAKHHLRQKGHQIIDASALNTAMETVSSLKSFGIEIAVLDGNLHPSASSGDDGRLIAKEIRQACPEIKILCWSRQRYDWGDAYQAKGPDYDALVQAVENLLKNKPLGF